MLNFVENGKTIQFQQVIHMSTGLRLNERRFRIILGFAHSKWPFWNECNHSSVGKKIEDLIPKVTSKPVGQFQGVKIKQNNFQLQSPRSPVAS